MTKEYTSFDDYITREPYRQNLPNGLSLPEFMEWLFVNNFSGYLRDYAEKYAQLKYQEGFEDAKQAALNTFKS